MKACKYFLSALAVTLMAAGCGALALKQDFSTVPGPRPAAGDRWAYQVVNGYNKLPVGRVDYEVLSAGADGIEVRMTRESERPEIRKFEAGWNPLSGHMAPGLPVGRGNVIPTGAAVAYSPALPALRFPLEPGATWKSRISVTDVASGRTIEADVSGKVDGRGEVETPAGRFDTIRVRQDIFYRDLVWWRTPIQEWRFEWYAPALGIVVRREIRSSYIDLTRGGGGSAGGTTEVMYGDWVVEQLAEHAPGKSQPQR